MFNEKFDLAGYDFNPSVIHIPEAEVGFVPLMEPTAFLFTSSMN